VAEPQWLIFARRFIGRKELPGPESAPWIEKLWFKLRAGWLWALYGDDSTLAWCGLFVAACLNELGYALPKHWYRARAWLELDTPADKRRLQALDFPAVGCIVVFERKGGGHVGFVVGQSVYGHLMVLGGNQGNSVSILPFDRERVLGYRWPDSKVLALASLPFVESASGVSQNEA